MLEAKGILSTCSDSGMKGANVFQEWQVFKTQVGRRVSQKAVQEKLAYVSKSLSYSASWLQSYLTPPSGCLTTVQTGTLLW